MTPDDQQHILMTFQQHVIANRGNTITDVVAHGLMAVLSIVTTARLDTQETAKETAKE